MFEIRSFEKYDAKIEYVIDFPDNYEKGKRYPVMFYMHGYGSVGYGIERIVERCPLQRERIPKDLPFILIKPYCPTTSWLFIMQTVVAFIEEIAQEDYCDNARMYLSGSSMGGYGAWTMIQAMPNRFAGAVICCGGGQYWASITKVFNATPIKAVHGKNDTTILPRESEILAKKINANGGHVELTILDNAHDVWTDTFTNPEIYYWLNSLCKKD